MAIGFEGEKLWGSQKSCVGEIEMTKQQPNLL